MLNVSPDWTPEERLEVIRMLSEKLTAILQYGIRDDDLALDLSKVIERVAAVAPQMLQNYRSEIEHVLLRDPA